MRITQQVAFSQAVHADHTYVDVPAIGIERDQLRSLVTVADERCIQLGCSRIADDGSRETQRER